MSFPFPLDQSLAFTPLDTPVVLGHIAYEPIARYCDALGLHPGDRVLCRATSPDHVLLKADGGPEIVLERRLAMFVEVERSAGGAAWAAVS